MSNPEKGADRAARTTREKELEGIRSIHDRIESTHLLEGIKDSIRKSQEAGKYTAEEAEGKMAEAEWFTDYVAGAMGASNGHTNLTDTIFGSLLTLRRQGNIPNEKMIPAMMLAFGLSLFEFITDLDLDDPRQREATKFWITYADTMFHQIWVAISDAAEKDIEPLLKSQEVRAGKGGSMHLLLTQAWKWATDVYPDGEEAARRLDKCTPHFNKMLLSDGPEEYVKARDAFAKAAGKS